MFKLGLVGEKLSHSQSPQIHREIMSKHEVDGTYELLEFSRETFAKDFNNLKNSGYRGVNITIPYKETVLSLLDEISEKAKYIGSVNTVSFENGKAKGFNTDYHGFVALLEHYDVVVKGKGAVILGSGGSAKAVVTALLDLGIYDLTIVSRGKHSFHGNYTISYEFYKEAKTKNDILINCTPVGMYPNVDASPLPKEDINTNVVIDLIYNPQKTLLLQYTEELGIRGISGSLMLKEQAVKAHEIWNGNENI
ncbi:MAG: shikimate dehydrogenase [Eubacteriales bacterium]|nr:shikimate dehydrogenase [Eubacteriales bacterium]